MSIHTVVFIPFAVDEALSESCVMSTAKPTPMIVDSKKIIYLLLTFITFHDSRSKIEVLNREIHKHVQLVAPQSTRAKSLQMHNQYIWSFPQLEFLACAAVLLATWTVPSVHF